MKRDRIIFVLENSFPYYAGGIENWTFNMIVRLKNNYRITIISEEPNYDQNKLYYSVPDGIDMVQYPSFRKYKIYKKLMRSYLSVLDYNYRKSSLKKTLVKVLRDCNNENVAVVSLSTLAASYAGRMAKRIIPDFLFVSSSRGPHADVMAASYPLLRKKLKREEIANMKAADRVITNGYDTQEYYKKQGVKSVVIKNGVDLGKYKVPTPISPYPTKSQKVVLSVGTLLDIKGVKELILAINKLKNEGFDDVHAYFAGKGDPDQYSKLAEKKGVPDNIHFVGHQSNLVPYYKNADAITCLSGGGGFGMAAIEAMASGKPVVAWNSPVYQQFNMDNKTMVLVKEKDFDSLAEGLKMVLLNKENYIEMCSNAVKEASLFDWEIVLKEFEKVINQ